MKEEIITIETEKLYDVAFDYMSVICGFDRATRMAEKSKANALKIREKIFNNTTMDFLVASFGKECVQDHTFVINGEEISCEFLSNIEAESVKGGYAFMFHAPMPDLSAYPISDVYAADSWQTSFVDAGRDVLREVLLEKYAKENGGTYYITDTLAPGLFGMKASSIRTFFKIMDASKIDLEILESGMMEPVKSFAGIYLIMDREFIKSAMDCANCISGGRNCNYCKNYTVNYMMSS